MSCNFFVAKRNSPKTKPPTKGSRVDRNGELTKKQRVVANKGHASGGVRMSFISRPVFRSPTNSLLETNAHFITAVNKSILTLTLHHQIFRSSTQPSVDQVGTMAQTLPKIEKTVTKTDNKIASSAAIQSEPTFKSKPKPKRKPNRKSKTTTGLESKPKLACVTPELIHALNRMALGFTLASDRKVVKDFFRYHRYQFRQDNGLEATEL